MSTVIGKPEMKAKDMLEWYIQIHLENLQSKAASNLTDQNTLKAIATEYSRISVSLTTLINEKSKLGFLSSAKLFEELEGELKLNIERGKAQVIKALDENKIPEPHILNTLDNNIHLQKYWYFFKDKIKGIE